MNILIAVLFALRLYAVGGVPLEYGTAVYLAAAHHDADPYEVGAILIAENKSREYDPLTVGRYGRGGEIGLFQLQGDTWSRYAHKVCEDGSCVFIPQEKLHEGDLYDPWINIEAAVVAIRYMREKHETRCLSRQRKAVREWRAAIEEYGYAPSGTKIPVGHDWRAHYRCAKRGRTTQKCGRSVDRVRRKEHALRTATVAVYWPRAVQGLAIAFTAPVFREEPTMSALSETD